MNIYEKTLFIPRLLPIITIHSSTIIENTNDIHNISTIHLSY
jgi:hypothetical protein